LEYEKLIRAQCDYTLIKALLYIITQNTSSLSLRLYRVSKQLAYFKVCGHNISIRRLAPKMPPHLQKLAKGFARVYVSIRGRDPFAWCGIKRS